MNTNINTNYGNSVSNNSASYSVNKNNLNSGAFSDMISEVHKKKTSSASDTYSRSAVLNPAELMGSAISSLYNIQSDINVTETAETKPASLEDMLRAKYPQLVYHVFDASSHYWRTRNDYPHYLLYQQDIDTKAIENWTPSGPNPFYGSVDGQFIAPKEIRALSSVPVGTTAVVIHPKVQERMEREPEYALEIMNRIDAWFTFDILRNEAMMPGITARSSRCIAIGEDGNIVNAQSHSAGRITHSGDDDSETIDWWDIRMARHAYFMALFIEEQLGYGVSIPGTVPGMGALPPMSEAASGISSINDINNTLLSATAKSDLAALMNDADFINALGDTIAGSSTKSVLKITQDYVWGNRSFPVGTL